MAIKRYGFTLAEVLITLGVIGVVAAITISTLINKYQEQATVTRLKKFYSVINQAYNFAVSKNETPDFWGLTADIEGSTKLGQILSKELSVTTVCGAELGCFPNGKYKYLNNNDWIDVNNYETFYKVILSDGTLVRFTANNPSCSANNGSTASLSNSCGIIGVDINGFKKPNKIGVDMFNFWVTKFGIVPYGHPDNTVHAFQAQCKNKSTHTGMACTAWVLYNGNMDYLHCNDLAWDGKRKCH